MLAGIYPPLKVGWLAAYALKEALVFDGRNLYEPGLMERYGIEYHCIGRPAVGAGPKTGGLAAQRVDDAPDPA